MRSLSEVIGWIALVTTLLAALVHFVFAAGIYRIASRREEIQQRGCYCVTPLVWSVATLLGGVFVAAVYWLIHDSGLSRAPIVPEQETPDGRHSY